MSWLNNANTIATLMLAIFGICGYVYGVVTFLRKKASPLREAHFASSQDSGYSQQKSSFRYKHLSWVTWLEFFGKGFTNTAEFVLNLLFDNTPERYFDTPASKLGGCAFLCGLIAVVGGLAMGVVIAIFLGALGMSNPAGAATAIVIILLFMFFSLLYFYHVGKLVEEERLDEYLQILEQIPEQQIH